MHDLFHTHNLFFTENFNRVETEVVFAANCEIDQGESREGMKVNLAPKWTRPKLPVPSVRWITKSVSLYEPCGRLTAPGILGISGTSAVLIKFVTEVR